jgi:hypothetical protein
MATSPRSMPTRVSEGRFNHADGGRGESPSLLTIRHDEPRRTRGRNLVRHFVEMVLAMLVGMAVLGMLARGICAALGHSGFLSDHPEIRAWVMGFNMSIGMAVVRACRPRLDAISISGGNRHPLRGGVTSSGMPMGALDGIRSRSRASPWNCSRARWTSLTSSS